MKIQISVPIYPTEDFEKLLNRFEDFFPEIKFKITKKEIKGVSEKLSSLDSLREKIIQKNVKNTVRYLMLEYKTENCSKIWLNKQSFAIGKVNFVEEKYPLGNVEINIETENLEKVLDYLTGIIKEE